MVGQVERSWSAHGVALVLSAAAVGCSQVYPLGQGSSLFLGVVAVMVASGRGDLHAGLAAAVAVALGNVFLVLRSDGTLDLEDATRLAMFCGVAVLAGLMNVGRARAEAAHAAAQAAVLARDVAVQLRDDLAQMVVHDLKNPVHGIAMLAHLALLRGAGLSAVERDEFERIERATSEMMRLIQNLLEIGRFEEGKMPVSSQPVVIGAVAAEVADECRPIAEEAGKRVIVATTPPAVAAVDRALTKRVLTNLVVNALRHSGSRDIRVDVTPLPEAGEVLVCVVDDGHGIPAEEQQRVFEKFAAGRSPRDGATFDTGLGLPFCKLAVERMGGRIALTSVPGAPTVFAVSLPLHKPPFARSTDRDGTSAAAGLPSFR